MIITIEQASAARANDNTTVRTYQDRKGLDRSIYGGSISIWKGDEDGATISIEGFRASCRISADPTDLRTIAAHCLAAAEEIEAAQAEASAIRPSITA
jgi:hypothetical protein